MRRKEFKAEERECIDFLKEKHDGVLTFAGPDGWPKAVPLNYAWHDGAVYFHGSKQGEKMAGIAGDPRAEFVVYQSHAFIPSYFSDPYLACPATVFFPFGPHSRNGRASGRRGRESVRLGRSLSGHAARRRPCAHRRVGSALRLFLARRGRHAA